MGFMCLGRKCDAVCAVSFKRSFATTRSEDTSVIDNNQVCKEEKKETSFKSMLRLVHLLPISVSLLACFDNSDADLIKWNRHYILYIHYILSN